jgi:hypothetical protein
MPGSSRTTKGNRPGDSAGPRDPSGVYRREDTVWRVSQSDDGGLVVEVLTDGRWVPGPVGMVGLRLDSSTTRLTQDAIDALPS